MYEFRVGVIGEKGEMHECSKTRTWQEIEKQSKNQMHCV